MKVVFWMSLGVIVYTQVGYLFWLFVQAKIRSRPVIRGPVQPGVSIVIASHNAVGLLTQKIENLAGLNYPAELVEIIVVSDGSVDGTEALLESLRGRVTGVVLKAAEGKAAALNHAVRRATREILVFFDTRQRVDRNAVAELCSCFADPSVGAVSGELVLTEPDGSAAAEGLGLYWKLEKWIRRLESDTGSVVGVTGAICAIRRELYKELPPGTILDDVLIPMNVARAGKRVVFQPAAIAWDYVFQEPGREFARKVRTLTGNFQLLRLAPWLLGPANPLLFRFIIHKLLRLAVPYLLLLMLVSSWMAHGWFYSLAFWTQLVVYILALLGGLFSSTRRFRAVAVAQTFTMLNVAAVFALYNVLTRRKNVWV